MTPLESGSIHKGRILPAPPIRLIGDNRRRATRDDAMNPPFFAPVVAHPALAFIFRG
jgi:hypothetical protein